MNNKALTLSVFMAFVAMFFVYSYVNSIEEEAKKEFGTKVTVVKAKVDIKENETVNETMLTLDLIPKRFLEPGAVRFEKKGEKGSDDEATQGLKELAGLVALVPIRKGEQLTRNKVTEPGLRTGLSSQIAPGRRAIAIPVNEFSGVSKLVKPGDRVDLIAVIDMGGGKENKLVKTILQDVVVLSVGRSVTNNVARMVEKNPYGGPDKVRSLAEDTSFSSVTLEVEPQQAQTMALVMSNGDSALSLALRNNDDTERTNVSATIFSDILGADGSRVRAPSAKR